MVMGETSSEFEMLGVLASKIRVWRCVDILFVRFRVCSENIPFFHTDSSDFQVVPGSFELPHTHTPIYNKGCRTGPPMHSHITRMRHPHET